jgi:hypothetical protein
LAPDCGIHLDYPIPQGRGDLFVREVILLDAATFVDQAPVQDRDLFQRLSLYFDAVDSRVKQGQGWLIFNAKGGRSRRISSFIELRLAEHTPPVSHYLMPWRDFALSAFVTGEALPELAPNVGLDERIRDQFNLAVEISATTWAEMLSTELLVLVGLKPVNRNEADLLDRTLATRCDEKRPTILLAPDMPQALADELQTVDPDAGYWDRIFQRMYETSFVAL